MLCALIVGGGWGLFAWGQKEAGFDRAEASENMQSLRQAIEELERQNLQLRDHVALLERSSQMDLTAYQDVNDNIKVLQDEVLELREEAAFYRGIVAPRETSAGVRIERFELDRAPGQAGLFHYQLVLTQVLKNDRLVRGNAELEVEGVQNGKPKTYELRELAADNRKTLGFKFKYFQKFEGDIRLPKDFQPRSVKVRVNPSKRKSVKGEFDWPKDGKKPIQQQTGDS